MISASPAPRVSSAGAGSIKPGSMRRISRVRSATTPTVPCPSTAPRPCRAVAMSIARQSQQRAQRTSGSRRSRSVTTPSTARFRARRPPTLLRQRNDLAHAFERAARTPARPRSKLTSDTCRCGSAARPDALPKSQGAGRGARRGDAECARTRRAAGAADSIS